MKNKIYKLIFKKMVLYTAIILSIFIVISYLKFGIIPFQSLSKKTNTYNVSYDDVLKIKKNNLIDGAHFKVMGQGVILDLDIAGNNYKYTYIYNNYLSNNHAKARISYAYNGVDKYKAVIQLKEGTNIYKIPNKLKFNHIRIQSMEDVMFIVGMSGVKLSSDFDSTKKVLGVSVLIFVVLLIIENRKEKISTFLKCFTHPLKKYINELKIFIKENKKMVLSVVFLGILSFGFMVTNFTLSIDEELKMMMRNPHDPSLVGYGRFGIYFLEDNLFVGGKFTPYVTDFIAAMLLTISTILFLFNFEQLYKNKSKNIWSMILFAGFFMSFPFVVGEYMSFAVYNVELGLSYVLVALGLYFSHQFYIEKKLSCFILAIIFIAIPISIYQSFVTVYISGTIMYCILINFEEDIKHKCKMMFSKILINAGILSISIVLYYILNKYFQKTIIPAFGYIDQNFIGWNRDIGFLNILKNVLEKIRFILMGCYDASGSILFGSICVFAIHTIWMFLKTEEQIMRLISAVLSILLIISPFILMLVLGTELPGRALQSLPLVVGCIWYLIIKYPVVKIEKRVAIIISMVLLFKQIQYFNLMFYGDYIRYQQDIFIGRQIMLDVQKMKVNYKDKPIVFIGSKSQDNSELISKVNSGGKSFFEDESQMYRMTSFLNTLGYSVITPTNVEIAEGKKCESTLNSWPMENSIKVLDNLIVIKLSESK